MMSLRMMMMSKTRNIKTEMEENVLSTFLIYHCLTLVSIDLELLGFLVRTYEVSSTHSTVLSDQRT